MKHFKAILLISLFLMASNAFCQYSFTSHRNKHFKKFFLTETIIPVTGFQTYDRKMREGLEKNWTFTKLKFVPASEMETYKNDKSVSILDLFSFEIDGTFGNTSLSVYIPGNIDDTRLTNVIASIPIKCSFSKRDNFLSECGYELIDYKIDILLAQLIEVIDFTRKEKYKPTLAHVTGISKYVNKYNKNVLETNVNPSPKPLLVSESFFGDELDAKDFGKFYKGNFKIVSQIEYKDILNSSQGEYLVMLHSNIPNSIISVFDLETKKTLYIGVNFGKSPIPSRTNMFNFTGKQVEEFDNHSKKLTLSN